MRHLILIAPICVSFLAGCGGSKEATVYEIPAAPPPTMPAAPMATALMAMADQQLPASALNQEAGNPYWEVPSNWRPGRASSMRRGSYAAGPAEAEADIAVTSFPGDVGGLLANINRWRGQIALAPLSEAELPGTVTQTSVHGKEVTLTQMDGPELSTRAAIFTHEGNSWFFKMTGPSGTVAAEESAFDTFISSVDFNRE